MMLVFFTHHIAVLHLSHVFVWCYAQQTAVTCNFLWTGCSHTAWLLPPLKVLVSIPGKRLSFTLGFMALLISYLAGLWHPQKYAVRSWREG